MKCDLCNQDVEFQNEYKDFRGNSFVVCCAKCGVKVRKMLDKFSSKYGGHLPDCGPWGSPRIRNIEHLREEVGVI